MGYEHGACLAALFRQPDVVGLSSVHLLGAVASRPVLVMSDAKVQFEDANYHENPAPGQEAYFSFQCPRFNRTCASLPIAGRVAEKRDAQNQNGGRAQWDWDHNLQRPSFAPSINCGSCWHGYIRGGRCVDVNGVDEPELRA